MIKQTTKLILIGSFALFSTALAGENCGNEGERKPSSQTQTFERGEDAKPPAAQATVATPPQHKVTMSERIGDRHRN
jgi:hypothetical protein